ncbi:MAG: DUF1800 domain-containing protein [Planctomycetes bacterium]|nr:DUF1800 domain-containing protein [Planctomycetota bacterium]
MTEPLTNVTNETDTVSVWTPYEPDDDAPWNLRRVVHLHRRVVFGACWSEIQRDLAQGPAAAVTRVIDGKVRAEGVPEGFEQLAGVIGAAAVDSGSAERLQAWWLYRCLFSPHPLEERLTLTWHNHFATSNLKLHDLRLMKQQNDTLRTHALSPFGVLLRDIVHDPALLEWLDASSNRAGQPNENLARELMELFTLGIGNYSEDDVKEAARALTGWMVRQNKFRNLESLHDEGEKTILSRTGNFDGDDLVDILLAHSATAKRLAWRICSMFFGEATAGGEAIEALAAGLTERKLDIGWAVETVLRSQKFHAAENLGGRILGPAEYVIGAVRALEMLDPAPSTVALAEWVGRLGQDLFYPPNVGGWNEGRSWLNARTALGRINFATALVEGKLSSTGQPFDPTRLAAKHGQDTDALQIVRFHADLLLGGQPSDGWCERLLEKLKPHVKDDAELLRKAVAGIFSSAEAQLA